jgi:hypothetical protein
MAAGRAREGMTAVVERFVHNVLVVYTPDATSVCSGVARKSPSPTVTRA